MISDAAEIRVCSASRRTLLFSPVVNRFLSEIGFHLVASFGQASGSFAPSAGLRAKSPRSTLLAVDIGTCQTKSRRFQCAWRGQGNQKGHDQGVGEQSSRFVFFVSFISRYDNAQGRSASSSFKNRGWCDQQVSKAGKRQQRFEGRMEVDDSGSNSSENHPMDSTQANGHRRRCVAFGKEHTADACRFKNLRFVEKHSWSPSREPNLPTGDVGVAPCTFVTRTSPSTKRNVQLPTLQVYWGEERMQKCSVCFLRSGSKQERHSRGCVTSAIAPSRIRSQQELRLQRTRMRAGAFETCWNKPASAEAGGAALCFQEH